MAKLVGKRYAEALFEVADEANKLEKYKEEIKAVADIFSQNPKLEIIFTHPRVTKNEKKEMIKELFDGRVSKEIVNLCYIVIDKNREKYIQDISDSYLELSNDKLGIVEAKAYTAVSMSEEELTKLQEKLSSSLGKKVELENLIDESLVGGVLVKAGDQVIDGSIKGVMNGLEKELNNIRLTAE